MKENNGWIKLHRKILNWGWYSDRDVRDVFVHLILTASHEKSVFLGKEINVGERVFGRIGLAKEIGISEQTLRTCLTKLKSTSDITIKSYNKYSVVSINNYMAYQSTNQRTNQPLTNNQPATNHIQEDKNIRIKENIYIAPEKIEEIAKNYNVEVNSVNEVYTDLVLYCKSKGRTYRNYEAALMNWIRSSMKQGKIKRISPKFEPSELVEEITKEQRLANLKKLDEMKQKFLYLKRR